MAGCNCKRGGGTLNNLNNKDYIEQAIQVRDTIINVKTIDEYNDLDKIEIMNTYSLLYPKASGTPGLQDAINQILSGIDLYGRKYKR